MTVGKINWKNPYERKKFEEELAIHIARRSKWSLGQKLLWAFETFFLQLLIIFGLYGICAYYMVIDAMAVKKSQEDMMKKNWLEQNNQVCTKNF